MQKLTVCELFAGVGGFRLGLEATNGFEVVWSNQWEPSTKTQHASQVYTNRFGPENHSNRNIEEVPTHDIPDHDVLVGGFPCQDYSVATSLKNSKGLLGKKGVLWWSIHRILQEKKNKPSFLILENVDRILKSPATQRGRDFAIMLNSLNELGYAVEWRVINAAEYGFPQRRRRCFLIGAHQETAVYNEWLSRDTSTWLTQKGVLANAFSTEKSLDGFEKFQLDASLVELSKNFNKNGKKSPFLNSGMSVNNTVFTANLHSDYEGTRQTLGDILQQEPINPDYYVRANELDKWEYLKGPKKEARKTKDGFVYNYSEGGMAFPDSLSKPSRTIITGEGGKSPSRFKHVVKTSRGLRRLTPIELERLNGFEDDHTKLEGITDAKRAFFMGNALVVGLIEKIGKSLIQLKNAAKE